MKISIDTKEDSHEEIRKVISMLQALVGGRETGREMYSNRDIFSDPNPEVAPSSSGGVFGNLFDNDKKGIDDKKEEEPESGENVEVIPY